MGRKHTHTRTHLVARIAVPSNYGPFYRGLETPRFLNGTVYSSYHGYFRFGSGFMPVLVQLYGSLMVHGYGSVKSQVINGTELRF